MSDSLQPHGLQHSRLPSATPGVCSKWCPLNQGCHSTISSFVTPFSSYSQSLTASESFLMSQLFASGGQKIGASASASVLPMNIQGWFPSGLIDLLAVQGFPSSSVGKESACNARDPGLNPGLGRSPGEGNGNPVKYSCLENFVDRGLGTP